MDDKILICELIFIFVLIPDWQYSVMPVGGRNVEALQTAGQIQSLGSASMTSALAMNMPTNRSNTINAIEATQINTATQSNLPSISSVLINPIICELIFICVLVPDC